VEGKPFGRAKAKATTTRTSGIEEEKEKKPAVEGDREVEEVRE